MLTFKEILGQVVQWLQGTSPTLNDAVPLLAVADLTGEGFYVAELHRLRGELL